MKHKTLYFISLFAVGLFLHPTVQAKNNGYSGVTGERKTIKEYESALKVWTRDDEAYSWGTLETRLVWHATYQSSHFREARLKRFRDLYELTEEEYSELRSEDAAEQEKYDTFFLSIYAGSREHPDIGKDRDLWRLVLETPDGQVIKPEAWEEIAVTQVTRTLYPYIDRWSKAFKVKFPKVINSATDNIRLKMVGVPADSTLSWRLADLK